MRLLLSDRGNRPKGANWAGVAFELRLGVEFCVDILVGDAAGLALGAAHRVQLLQQAVAAIEEAAEIFRSQGLIAYLVIGLENAIRRHLELAQHTGKLAHARVLALCQEGEALCGPMEDQERLTFFRQVRQQLQS
jgi:hypothetical protein